MTDLPQSGEKNGEVTYTTPIIFGFLFTGKMRWKKKELGLKELLCFT
jgi:hypothetical protein